MGLHSGHCCDDGHRCSCPSSQLGGSGTALNHAHRPQERLLPGRHPPSAVRSAVSSSDTECMAASEHRTVSLPSVSSTGFTLGLLAGAVAGCGLAAAAGNLDVAGAELVLASVALLALTRKAHERREALQR